ncbi:unnamed protein product [Dibothriocephalus latus]|uniref:Reverse transcriptase domain-containing protein n=1 Tax=Dibothriocephalus latus TaxID=60516 RepID=A0A3P7L1G7_DIBLA|nr:unnamed protein product [Dibothriocephalus latus]
MRVVRRGCLFVCIRKPVKLRRAPSHPYWECIQVALGYRRRPGMQTHGDVDPSSSLKDFKDVKTIHLHKRKENRQLYDSPHGISPLSYADKIFARVLLNRLSNHLEQGLLPESQCGFRFHRGTTDMIFAARQLQ